MIKAAGATLREGGYTPKRVNEDALHVGDGLYIVADGISSCEHAAMGSRTACKKIAKYCEGIMAPGPGMLESAIMLANDELADYTARTGFGCASAITVAWVDKRPTKEGLVWIAHLGDTGATAFERWAYEGIVGTQLVPRHLTAEYNLDGSMLTKCIGSHKTRPEDIVLIRTYLEPGDALLLYSDGLGAWPWPKECAPDGAKNERLFWKLVAECIIDQSGSVKDRARRLLQTFSTETFTDPTGTLNTNPHQNRDDITVLLIERT